MIELIGEEITPTTKLTKREYFAAMAFEKFLTLDIWRAYSYQDKAAAAVVAADVLISELEK